MSKYLTLPIFAAVSLFAVGCKTPYISFAKGSSNFWTEPAANQQGSFAHPPTVTLYRPAEGKPMRAPSTVPAPVRRIAKPPVFDGPYAEVAPSAGAMYQRSESGVFGRGTYTSTVQSSGSVVEEVSIGDRLLSPFGALFGGPRPTVGGVTQGGYVPSGTSAVYDPTTGRTIPVRRR